MSDERVARFVEAVRDDPRVVGVARLREDPFDVLRFLVVTTWDGFETLPPEMPRLGRMLLAPGDRMERTIRVERSNRPRWCGIDGEGSRVELTLRRVGDLVPDLDGVDATAVHDPRRAVDQWIRVSRSADRDDLVGAMDPTTVEDLAFSVDHTLRVVLNGHCGPIRGAAWGWDPVRASLRATNAAESALLARMDLALRSEPREPEGLRPAAGTGGAPDLEAFLRVADDEGFKGDRVLFGEAIARLREHAKREPDFDQGFMVPTFDAVEAGFALGEAVGGCKPPLVPGVYVGVGVTPKADLEFWAAPFVREPTCSVACVDDLGERDVVPRVNGSEALVASLTATVDAAWDRLPAYIERARAAAKESVDPAAVLKSVHLPRSFVERAKLHGADALMCSRLTVARSLALAGDGCAPLVARKFGLAAGRVLAAR